MNQSSENSHGNVVLYEAADGEVRLEVRLERETVWLSLDQMTKLFGRDKSVISRHLRNVFASKELERKSVVAKNATTALSESVINDIGLAALALLIAESDPKDKEILVRLVMNMLAHEDTA